MSRNKFLASSTFRLALLYVTLFTVSVLALFTFIYWSSARYMAAQSDAAMETEIRILSERYERSGVVGLRRLILERITRQQPTGSALYLLMDPLSRPVVGNISRWPAVEEKDGWLSFRLETRDRDDAQTHPARAKQFALSGGFRLLVGEDIQELKAAERQIIVALSWGVILTLLLGLAGGFFISRRMMARLEVINETSQRIIDGDLRRRVPVSHRGDEFDRLATHLNRMLDQIQELMEGIRQVSDNIAHDLKTPLSRLRQDLEEISTQRPHDPELSETLSHALREADRLLGLFNALLRIARIESETVTPTLVDLSLADLIKDIVEFYEPLADDKHQKITLLIDDAPQLAADRDMLFQSLANIMDNAIKYTPMGGRIQLRVGTREDRPFLSICDSGPGIATHEHDRVFQRFYRTDASRSTPGNGLGLSLARAVLQLHGAVIRLKANDPGLCVDLFFQGTSTAPATPR
ncbi:MAG: ATP-binding protein [Arenicellales bacterium]|nr:sensor histidine kinase [Gammaproteobacteria bacterium]NDG43283.1 sensor histidine kinase [Gammaproteobacteria bacterium]